MKAPRRDSRTSCSITPQELHCNYIGTHEYNGSRGRVGELKSWVAIKTGVPPKRQVYHCLSKLVRRDGNRYVYDIDPRNALPLPMDCESLRPILARYERERSIKCLYMITVRFLPDNREAADDDDIQVVRESNVLEESIARGRTRAVEVPESDEEDGGEDEWPPRAKRPRKAAARSGGADDGEGKSDAEGDDRKPAADRGGGRRRLRRR